MNSRCYIKGAINSHYFVNCICGSTWFTVFNISRNWSSLSITASKCLFQADTMPRIAYCSNLLNVIPHKLLNRIQLIRNQVARMVLPLHAYNIATSHYCDVIMGTIASQITSLVIVYSAVYSEVYQRKHQSSASLAFVRGIHRGPVNSPHKGPVTRKMFPFDDVIMTPALTGLYCFNTGLYSLEILAPSLYRYISMHFKFTLQKPHLKKSITFFFYFTYWLTLMGLWVIILRRHWQCYQW